MSKIHLHGLDSLRAIAAMVVVLSHIEIFKRNYELPNAFFQMPAGNTGVILFFVISGFLITWLLLREKNAYRTISIKKFYLRRILRIWPLYFIILFLSAVLFNYKPDHLTLISSLLILPNIPHIVSGGWAASPQIWSIGVEEQFYVAWPVLLKFVRKKLKWILILIIVIYPLLPYLFLPNIPETSQVSGSFPFIVQKFFESAKFNCMAMGGLLACFVDDNFSGLKCIRKKPISYFLIILPFALWAFNVKMGYFTDDIMGLLFTLMIANVVQTEYFVFNNRLFNYLGRISYGIYMYHWIIVGLLIRIFLPYFKLDFLWTNILFYVVTILMTVLIASVSFFTIERWFLNLKAKYEIV